MSKRVLMVATVPSMIGQFNMDNIRCLLDMGYEVDVATDFKDTSYWPAERINRFKETLGELGVKTFQLDFSRSPLKLRRHISAYKETVSLIRQRKYSFIHTHTPIASAIVRMAARKTGTKVIYTAHGFHFYDGAPLKNWLIFYPVEKRLSRCTDILITITQEDFERAKKKFRAKRTAYVPGVGVDTGKFVPQPGGRERIREELGLKEDDILLLSVGELNENKNHISVIKAISGMKLTYAVVGKGEKKEELEKAAKEAAIDLRLPGFRTDIADFYAAADIYILPSIREGLNVSLMEAMSAGLPVSCGKIRGNTDLIGDAECLFKPTDTAEIRKAILATIRKREELGQKNLEQIRAFDKKIVEKTMAELYGEV